MFKVLERIKEMAKNPELQALLKAYLETHPGSERQLADEYRTAIGTITRWANGYSSPAPACAKAIIASLKSKIQAG